MGIMDGFHAISPMGQAFVFLRTLAVLCGGLGFLCVWLWESLSRAKWYSAVPWAVVGLAGLVGIFSLGFSEYLPTMFQGNEFTNAAKSINSFSGVLFLIGGVNFALEFHRQGKTEDYLFTVLALLFGLAGIVFSYSRLWDYSWWFWHVLRLAAYLLVVIILVRINQRVNQELRESEERLRSVIENTNAGYFYIDRDGYFQDVNNAWIRMYKYECPGEVVGKHFKEVLKTNDAESAEEYVSGIMAGDPRYLIGEFSRKCADGSIGYHHASARPVVKAGEVVGLFGFLIDTTEQRLAQQALIDSENRFRKMIEKSPVPMSITSGDQKITFFNDRFTEIFGYTLEDFQSAEQWWRTLYPDPEYRRLVQQSWQEAGAFAVAQGTDMEMQEWEITTKGGERRHCEFRMVPLGDFSLVVINDITERIQALEAINQARIKAEAASRAKSRFLANMSHELRTPLNAIIGMTGLVLDSRLDDKQRENLEIVEKSSAHLHSLVSDILDLSKIEAGKLELEKASFGLRSFLRETIEPESQRARGKGLDLVLEVSPDVPDALVGDAGRLRQVLLNLLGNAVKFTQQGRIRVAVDLKERTQTQAMLQISISDTGIGFQADAVSDLFKPFFQADASSTRKYGGTGLGLAISRQLVEMMGGTIWAENAPRGGAVFRFTARFDLGLPGKKSEVQMASTTPGPDRRARSQPLPGLKILLAEDNPINQKLATCLLEKRGHTVIVTANGREVLRALEQDAPDLILMDVEMPEMDGLDTTRAIRQREQGGDERIPIIALTAHAMKGDRERCLSAGMDDYLTKPIDPQKLELLLQKYSL